MPKIVVPHVISYINYEELEQMKDDDKVVVYRGLIHKGIMAFQFKEGELKAKGKVLSDEENAQLDVLYEAQKLMMERDWVKFNGSEFYRPVFGVELPVKFVKDLFTKEAIDSGTNLKEYKPVEKDSSSKESATEDEGALNQ